MLKRCYGALAVWILVACETSSSPAATPAFADLSIPPPSSSAPPREDPSAAAPDHRPSLRVATYNILAAKRGVEGIVTTLQSLNADVIGLQEVDRNTRRFGRVDLPEQLGRRTGLHHAFVRHRRYQGGEIGVALLSRYPIHDVQRVAAQGSELGMLSAWLQTPGGRVDVLVVHTHPTDPRDPPPRRARFDRLRLQETETAAALASRSRSIIVLGDFNATPSSPEYARMQADLRDACVDAGPTWPATFPVITLDYIWTSRRIESRGCRTVHGDASDHRARVVDLFVTP